MDKNNGTSLATRVAKWRGDADGAFVLFYDDGCDSAYENAVPSLVRNGVKGTFYICAGWFDKTPSHLIRWGEATQSHGENIFLGNHTWSHRGAKTLEEARIEIYRNDDRLRSIIGLSSKDLMSYMGPGGCEWLVSEAETKALLEERHLVHRPNEYRFREILVAGRTHHTAEDVVAVMETAEQNGTCEAMLFHGIGGDWFNFSPTEHEIILKELARRERAGSLWNGSCIDVQKYQAEREAATVTTQAAADGSISVELTVDIAPEYDVPLTLVTSVPRGWYAARIEQGGSVTEVEVSNGLIQFDVAPVSGTLCLAKQR